MEMNKGVVCVCAALALQVVAELPYEDVNCFVPGEAVVVPMRTFLSQLP